MKGDLPPSDVEMSVEEDIYPASERKRITHKLEQKEKVQPRVGEIKKTSAIG